MTLKCGTGMNFPRKRLVRRRSSGCCWKKLLEKAFTNKKECGEIQAEEPAHQELIYLNTYLSTLERKMEAIEEVALRKIGRQKELKNKPEERTINQATDMMNPKQNINYLSPSRKILINESPSKAPPGNIFTNSPEEVRNNSEAIIKEILSLGHQNFDLNKKWNSLISTPLIAERGKKDFSDNQGISSYFLFHTIKTFQVGAKCYPVEFHNSIVSEMASTEGPKLPVKASCSINYFDNENNTIEITYDNKEWDKKGTIVLKDIEKQIGVQAELIGRVVCFLLGMGEVDLEGEN